MTGPSQQPSLQSPGLRLRRRATNPALAERRRQDRDSARNEDATATRAVSVRRAVGDAVLRGRTWHHPISPAADTITEASFSGSSSSSTSAAPTTTSATKEPPISQHIRQRSQPSASVSTGEALTSKFSTKHQRHRSPAAVTAAAGPTAAAAVKEEKGTTTSSTLDWLLRLLATEIQDWSGRSPAMAELQCEVDRGIEEWSHGGGGDGGGGGGGCLGRSVARNHHDPSFPVADATAAWQTVMMAAGEMSRRKRRSRPGSNEYGSGVGGGGEEEEEGQEPKPREWGSFTEEFDPALQPAPLNIVKKKKQLGPKA